MSVGGEGLYGPSKKEQSRSICQTGKYTFFTKAEIKTALDKVRGAALKKYPCNLCGFWHYTTRTKKKKKIKSKEKRK